MPVLSYLPNLLRGMRLAFAAYFLHDFSSKSIFYLILHLWTRFQCHTFIPSQDIKQNVLLSSYLDNR